MTFDDLRRALDARAAAADPVRLWWRDDDAVAPSDALDRMLRLAGGHIPLTLAVIPAVSGQALADRLAQAPGVSVAVHGWAHADHAGGLEKKQELGRHRPAPAVLAELQCGLHRLTGLHGARLVPVLVPPWNRIDPAVTAGLPGIGFRALSVFGPPKPAPLAVINTQVDLIDWRGSRGGRAEPALLHDTLQAMQSDDPVGILTHHLVHDGPAWDFLRRFLAATSDHPGARWTGLPALLPAGA